MENKSQFKNKVRASYAAYCVRQARNAMVLANQDNPPAGYMVVPNVGSGKFDSQGNIYTGVSMTGKTYFGGAACNNNN